MYNDCDNISKLCDQRKMIEESVTGYGSGWDLIVPAGWGMPVWMGLVFRGARPGGLRETEKLTLEAASGPVLPPDSSAGQALSEHYRKQLEAKHFKYVHNLFFLVSQINISICVVDYLLSDLYSTRTRSDNKK